MSDPNEKAEGSATSASAPTLSETLLQRAIPSDDHPERRWVYPIWGIVLVSFFVLYHSAILLVHNLPSKGLSADLHKLFNDKLQMRKYMQTNGNTQSWAMFAPNPHRSNVFMRVLVKTKDGEVLDLQHDIYQRRKYPYLFYDRMGKINRRIIDQKGYRRHYAAWVCRDWERTHDGEVIEEVQFVKMWTRIPNPEDVIERANGNLFQMGYDPAKLHLHQREEDRVACRTVRHGQLPDYLRERYGLAEEGEYPFRPVFHRTWHDLKEAKANSNRRARTVGTDLSAIQRKDIK